MAYWRWEQMAEDFPGSYKSGQSYEESLKTLRENFPTSPYDQDLILEVIQSVDPGYTITEQDEAERESRRAISEIARNNLFAHMHKLSVLKDYPKGQSIERGLDMVFDFGDGPDAEKNNEKARSLFAKQEHTSERGKTTYSYPNSGIDERTAWIQERLDRLFETDFSKLYTMTDREIAENFTKMHPLFVLLSEGGDNLESMNGDAFNLPQTYINKMKELKWQHQGIMGSIKNRFECITNPNYEIFHYERMKAPEGENFSSVGPYGAEGLAERLEDNLDVQGFFSVVNKFRDFNSLAYVDRINHEIEKLNIPENMLLPPETDDRGDRIASPLLKVFLPGREEPLSTMELQKGFDMVCFTNPVTGQTHFLKSDGVNYKPVDLTRMPESLKSGADKLMKELEAADPWYIRIFSGSREFDEMKKAMKAVKELKDQLPLNPNKEQREEMTKRLSTLTEKTNAYLLTKKGGIQDDSSDAERARITAAENLKSYSLESKALMGSYEQNLAQAYAFREKVHDAVRDTNEKGMEKQYEEEKAFERPRTFIKTDRFYEQAQAQEIKKAKSSLSTFEEFRKQNPEVVNEQAKRKQEMQKAKFFYTEGFSDEDPLKALADQIYENLTKEEKMGEVKNVEEPKVNQDETETERANRTAQAERDKRAERIAQVVTLDIILRERKGNGKGMTGPIEAEFIKGPGKFVEGMKNSSVLQDYAIHSDDQHISDMIRAAARGGTKTMTDKILKDMGMEIKQVRQSEPKLQNQAVIQGNQSQVPSVPSVPEPPKGGGIGMGGGG